MLLQLGRTVLRHQVLIAEASEDVILGMDFSQEYNIKLDMGNRTVCIEHKDLVLTTRQNHATCKTVEAEGQLLAR